MELFVTSAIIGAGLLAGGITLYTIGELAAKLFGFVETRVKMAWSSHLLRRTRRLDREYLARNGR